MVNTIEGVLTADKRLSLKSINAVNEGESLTSILEIALPSSFTGYDYYAEFDCGGKSYFTEKLVPGLNNVISYGIPANVLANTGEVKVQVTAIGSSDQKFVFKSLLNSESSFYVYASVNSDSALKIFPNAISRAEESSNNCIAAALNANSSAALAQEKAGAAQGVADGLLADKANGVFKGEKGDKGDKGDPSSFDTIGQVSGFTLDLSDIQASVFGTAASPLQASGAVTICFSGCAVPAGAQRSFILYLKRLAGGLVIWNPSISWAYGEAPLLPEGRTQKIMFETSDGIKYYGVSGDYFNA